MLAMKQFFKAFLRFCFIVGLPIVIIMIYGYFYPHEEDEDLREKKIEVKKKEKLHQRAFLLYDRMSSNTASSTMPLNLSM